MRAANPGTIVWKRTSRKHEVLVIAVAILNSKIAEGVRTKVSSGTNIFFWSSNTNLFADKRLGKFLDWIGLNIILLGYKTIRYTGFHTKWGFFVCKYRLTGNG